MSFACRLPPRSCERLCGFTDYGLRATDNEPRATDNGLRQGILMAVPLHLVEHPLVHDALATLRDSSTPPELFRRIATRISLLLATEATRDVPADAVTVQTPLGPAPGRRVKSGVVVVPV